MRQAFVVAFCLVSFLSGLAALLARLLDRIALSP